MSWVEDNLLAPGERILYSVNCKRGEAAVTSHRLVYENKSLFTRDVLDINLTNVENVSVKRDLLGHLFNKGTIIVGSSSGNRDIVIPGVPAPMEFRRQALAAVDART